MKKHGTSSNGKQPKMPLFDNVFDKLSKTNVKRTLLNHELEVMNQADFSRLVRLDSERGYTSSLSSHPCAPTVLELSECHTRSATGESQNCGEKYGTSLVSLSQFVAQRFAPLVVCPFHAGDVVVLPRFVDRAITDQQETHTAITIGDRHWDISVLAIQKTRIANEQ